VVATHGAAHNQQFEVECTVPKLDVKVSGSGASRRAAEQAAAKKALEEVVAVAPALVAKPKRSKAARAAKHAEPEIVPGVAGVQTALDLRAPDHRKADRAARSEQKHGSAADVAVAERPAAVPATTSIPLPVPLAVIRAAHVEYSEHGQIPADKEKAAEKVGEKAVDKSEKLDKPAEKSEPALAAEKAAEKPAERSADKADTLVRTSDKPTPRARESIAGTRDETELEPGVAGVVQTRAADAGH
jgi:ribonuclease-3